MASQPACCPVHNAQEGSAKRQTLDNEAEQEKAYCKCHEPLEALAHNAFEA